MGSDPHQPAFPNAWEETNEHGVKFPFVTNGLTKREYFAVQALAGLLAQSPCSASAEQFAQEAVRAADALIKALEAPDAED
jgi:hypothetical protein